MSACSHHSDGILFIENNVSDLSNSHDGVLFGVLFLYKILTV